MLDEISPEQFDEWVAWDSIEWGAERRADWRVAQAVAILATVLGVELDPATILAQLDPDTLAAKGEGKRAEAIDEVATAHNVALAFGATR